MKDRTWLLLSRKISGEATLDELRELEILLKEQADLAYQASLIKELNLATPDPATDTEPALEKHMERMRSLYPADFSAPGIPGKVLRSRQWWMLAAAACIMAIIAGGLLLWHAPKKTGNRELASEITTRYGSRSKVTLPDGSKVWLNANSRLTYDYSCCNNRLVTLEGEAFFDVLKDDRSPFVIRTAKMDITVLGTTLNVRSYREDNTVETSLIQGKIEVTIKGAVPRKVILQPSQKIVLPNHELAVQQPAGNADRQAFREGYRLDAVSVNPRDSLIAETAWTENCLVFNNERFEDIAVKMERWYDVDIVFEDRQVKEYRFTGTFINETVEETLEALRFSSPFHYRIDKKKIIIKR